MNELAFPSSPVPAPRREGAIAIRVATPADVPFMDGLQKLHSKQVGYFPTKQFEGYVAMGAVLVADVGATLVSPSSPARVPTEGDTSVAPTGYIISRDRYLKRDELGVIYQLCVVPGEQRKLIGATLLKEVFERSAYGCKLYCCWCAQDIAANHFWESMGFLPIAFRAGSTGKRRVHIFWQRRINAEDTGEKATPYWYPCQTNSGAIREDRLVFPIPPGTHWTEVQAVAVPSTAKPALPAPRKTKAKLAVGAKGGPQAPTPRPRAGVQFGPPPATPMDPAPAEKPAPLPREKTPRVKEKIDPQLVAKARELRDRYLEQVNDRLLIAPRGKYDVGRAATAVPAPAPTLPLPMLKAG